MAKVLIAVMVESGLAEDPDALMAEVEPMLEGAEPEGMDDMDEDDAPGAPGALAAARQGAMA
jgi:hypothetical protein